MKKQKLEFTHFTNRFLVITMNKNDAKTFNTFNLHIQNIRKKIEMKKKGEEFVHTCDLCGQSTDIAMDILGDDPKVNIYVTFLQFIDHTTSSINFFYLHNIYSIKLYAPCKERRPLPLFTFPNLPTDGAFKAINEKDMTWIYCSIADIPKYKTVSFHCNHRICVKKARNSVDTKFPDSRDSNG